jgi:acetyl esterase/lipase
MSDKPPMPRRTFLELGGAAAIGHSLGAFNALAQTTTGAPALKVEKDVAVGKAGNIDLLCDIYKPPAGTEKRMAIVHFHGGGFAGGSKEGLAAKVAPITARGYVSVAVQYRLSGAAMWPAQIDDAKTAIRWTRANAVSLGIDPKLIAIAGYSAGGHIALFTAGVPETQLAACLAFYPQTDLNDTHMGGAPRMVQALLPPGADEAAIREASPITHIKAGYPPTIIFHGLVDTTIPVENSQHLLQTLRGAGVPSELHTFEGVPHEFDQHPEFAEACAALSDFFLDRYILHPRTYPPFGRGGAAPGTGGGAGAAGRPAGQ